MSAFIVDGLIQDLTLLPQRKETLYVMASKWLSPAKSKTLWLEVKLSAGKRGVPEYIPEGEEFTFEAEESKGEISEDIRN